MKQILSGRVPLLRYFAILPPLLAGCASHTEPLPVAPPAQQTVDAFIHTAQNSLMLAQNELARVSGVRITPPPTSVSHTTAIPAAAGKAASSGVSPSLAVSVAPSAGSTSHLRQSGTPPAMPPLVTRSGRGRTLADALHIIIPPDWKVTISPPLRNAASISWNGGASWPQTLDALAVRYHLVVSLNWTTHQASLDRQAPCTTPSGTLCSLSFRSKQ